MCHSSNQIQVSSVHPYAQFAYGAIAAGVVAAAFFAIKGFGLQSPMFLWSAFGAAIVGAGLALLVYLTWGRSQKLTLTADSIQLINSGQTVDIPLENVAGFRFAEQDVNLNGVYNSTFYQLHFKEAEENGKQVRFDASATYGSIRSESLETIRNVVSQLVAQRMLSELELAGMVSWTKDTRFLEEGVVQGNHHAKYDEITDCVMTDGYMKIAVNHENRPTIGLSSKLDNFYPGLELLDMLIEHSAGAEQAGAIEKTIPVAVTSV